MSHDRVVADKYTGSGPNVSTVASLWPSLATDSACRFGAAVLGGTNLYETKSTTQEPDAREDIQSVPLGRGDTPQHEAEAHSTRQVLG